MVVGERAHIARGPSVDVHEELCRCQLHGRRPGGVGVRGGGQAVNIRVAIAKAGSWMSSPARQATTVAPNRCPPPRSPQHAPSCGDQFDEPVGGPGGQRSVHAGHRQLRDSGMRWCVGLGEATRAISGSVKVTRGMADSR
ncbi:MAG: hypothetical protein ACRDQW_14025 [Haloechinothrix sp.]